MSLDLRKRIFDQLDAVVLIDPHTHINALNPASDTLADILGYHYYTELAHSAGMPKSQIEEPGLDPKEKVARLIANLGPINNTVQYSWFVEMARELFDFEGDRIDGNNWEAVYDTAAAKMASPAWTDEVLKKSKLEAVFLTNDFDDPLEAFDTAVYVPCLRNRRPGVSSRRAGGAPPAGRGRWCFRHGRGLAAQRDRVIVSTLQFARSAGLCHFAAARFYAG